MSTYEYPQRRGPKRPPCWSVPELADHLGLPAVALGKLLSREGAPEPVLVRHPHGRGWAPVRYYVVAEVTRWYRALQAEGRV